MVKKDHGLLNEQYRPNSLDGFVGNDNVKAFLQKSFDTNNIQNLCFYGPAGTGKSSLSKLIVNKLDCDSIIINASLSRGMEVIRDEILRFANSYSFKPLKVIVLEECLEENTLVKVLRKGKVMNIPIKDLDEKNDLVSSYNTKKDRIEWKPFYLWDKGEQETYEIEFENGEVVICTEDHKWYFKDSSGELKVVKTKDLSEYGEIFNPPNLTD